MAVENLQGELQRVRKTLDLGRRLVNGTVKVFSRGMTTDSVDEYRV
jgi:hypothetical protein